MEEKKPVADERLPDEAKLRRYLLGRCSPEEEKEIELSIFREGAQPILEVVEDELIEDYIIRELDRSDRFHFERRLLCSQAVTEKMMLVVRLRYGQDRAEKLGTRIEALKQRFHGWDAAALWNEAAHGVDPSDHLGSGSGPAAWRDSLSMSAQKMLFVMLHYGQDAAEKLGTRIVALKQRFHDRNAAARWNEAVRGVNPSDHLDSGSGPALRPLGSRPAWRDSLSISAGPSSRTNVKIRIAALIATGLICALFLVSNLPPHEGHLHTLDLPPDTDTLPATPGATPIREAVIYMRRFTTEKQLEDFRSSVLAQAGRKNELPSFVESYYQFAPNHIWGRWAIVIMLKKESRRDEVEGYVEGIKRDGRVDHVDMRGPSGKHP
jgi:hypothetical protein